MSHIVDALLFPGRENEAIEALNRDLEASDAGRRQHFHRIEEDFYAGLKGYCADLWVCAFNHFGAHEIEQAVARTRWEEPDGVILIVHPYDSDELPRSASATQLREKWSDVRDAFVNETGERKESVRDEN